MVLIGLGCAPPRQVEVEGEQNLAELGDYCGEATPYQVLSLPPDRIARYVMQRDDRLVYYVTGLAGETQVETQLWSTGRCGEDPLLLSTELGVPVLFTDELLMCGAAREGLWWVDPHGQTASHQVFEGRHCKTIGTEGGVVIHDMDEETFVGPLVMNRDPADPDTEEEVLLEDVRALRYIEDREHEIIATRVGGDVHIVDLRTGEVGAPILSNAQHATASPDGSFIVWQTASEEDCGVGPVWVRNVQTGQDFNVGDFTTCAAGWFRGALVARIPGQDRADVIVSIAHMNAFEFEGGVSGGVVLADGRLGLVVENLDEPDQLGALDLETGDFEVFSTGPRILTHAANDGSMWAYFWPDIHWGWLRQFEVDGSSESVLDRVGWPHARLEDGRFVHVPRGTHGVLMLSEPFGGHGQIVDRRVSAESLSGPRESFEGGFAYSVAYAGERSGVWVASPLE